MRITLLRIVASTLLVTGLLPGCNRERHQAPRTLIRLATTAEVRASGLLEILLPAFTEETGVQATVVTSPEEADVFLTQHAQAAPSPPQDLRAAWWTPCLILGPGGDARRSYGEHNHGVWARGRSPLGTASVILTNSSARMLLHEILLSAHAFIRRGDGSAIDSLEQALRSSEDMLSLATRSDYFESGPSMDLTLAVADKRSAYLICDASTYLRHRHRVSLEIVLARDAQLTLFYMVRLAKSAAPPTSRSLAGQQLADWLCSGSCRALLKSFRVNGERPFYAPGEELTPTLRGRLDVEEPEPKEPEHEEED